MITVNYNNQDYRVGFNRSAAQAAENDGLDIGQIGSRPNVMIPLLVYHAFRAFNPKIKRQLVDEIYGHMSGKERFVSALVDLYADTVNTLLEDDDEGNATWTTD